MVIIAFLYTSTLKAPGLGMASQSDLMQYANTYCAASPLPSSSDNSYAYNYSRSTTGIFA